LHDTQTEAPLRVINLLRLVRQQEGTALVMVVGILAVLTISGTTMMVYTSQNTKTASRSKVDETSFSLSEAALNNAMAVLSNPTNNALDPEALPSTEATASTLPYENGTAKWYGVLDRAAAVWTVTALGVYDNPGGGTQVTRRLTAKVPVTPTYTQPLNNPVWNYLYAGHTGSTCDQSLNNNISGSSRMYVAGNLCLSPNVQLAQSKVIVGGNLDVENNAAVGASTDMSTRVETYVGGSCRYAGGAWAACSGDQDLRHVYSKLANGTTVGVDHSAPVVPPPTADYALWYENAIPGPSQSCTTSSGTPPAFDNNYPSRDNSVSTVFDLTPATSYMCRVGPGSETTLTGAMTASQTSLTVASASGFPASQFHIRIDDEIMTVTGGFGTTTWTVTRGASGTTAKSHVNLQTVSNWDAAPSGELTWNAATKTLIVQGTIFIDGSAKISNGAINTYNGQAAIYLSGTFRGGGSLCGASSGSSCDFATWNPNQELLTIIANGNGGSNVNPGDSIQFENNMYFEGALYATNAIEFGNNANIGGPIVGSQILLSNNLTTYNFPTVTTVPVGMPSNPAVYAQPNPPQMFAG
jgi:Tfp pilus assembly protein PilX